MNKEEFLKDFYNKKLTAYISWPTFRKLAEDYIKNSDAPAESLDINENKYENEFCECDDPEPFYMSDENYWCQVCFKIWHP